MWVILSRSARLHCQPPALSACDPLPSVVRTTPPASAILRESNDEATPIPSRSPGRSANSSASETLQRLQKSVGFGYIPALSELRDPLLV